MTQEDLRSLFRTVGDGSGLSQTNTYYEEELALAFRNRGMPLEGLRYDITPTGMHYLLIHFDIPEADADTWRLDIGGLVSQSAQPEHGGHQGAQSFRCRLRWSARATAGRG